MKHNMPTRICFATVSVKDSISTIDEEGAEELKGSGDMLVKLLNISKNTILHLQAAYISGSEIKEVTELSQPQTQEQNQNQEQNPANGGD